MKWPNRFELMTRWATTFDILKVPPAAQVSRCVLVCGRRTSDRRGISRSRFGYTLLELLIVLAIILIVSALAAPSLMERVRSGNVREAAQHVSEVLAAARTYAIDTGVDYPVVLLL